VFEGMFCGGGGVRPIKRKHQTVLIHSSQILISIIYEERERFSTAQEQHCASTRTTSECCTGKHHCLLKIYVTHKYIL